MGGVTNQRPRFAWLLPGQPLADRQEVFGGGGGFDEVLQGLALGVRAALQKHQHGLPVAGGGGPGEGGFAGVHSGVYRRATVEQEFQDFRVGGGGEESWFAERVAGVRIGAGVEEHRYWRGSGFSAGEDGDFEGFLTRGVVGVGAGGKERAKDFQISRRFFDAVEGKDEDAGGARVAAEAGGVFPDCVEIAGKDGVLDVVEGGGAERGWLLRGIEERANAGGGETGGQDQHGRGDEGERDEPGKRGLNAKEPDGEAYEEGGGDEEEEKCD